MPRLLMLSLMLRRLRHVTLRYDFYAASRLLLPLHAAISLRYAMFSLLIDGHAAAFDFSLMLLLFCRLRFAFVTLTRAAAPCRAMVIAVDATRLIQNVPAPRCCATMPRAFDVTIAAGTPLDDALC